MRTYSTDLTHLLDENGLPPVDAPRELFRALNFFSSIIEAGSSHPVGTRFPSAIPCRRRRCSRQGLTIVNGSDGAIHWECPSCGENGRIDNWQGSSYDLSAAAEMDLDLRVGLLVSPEEHRSLRAVLTNSQEEQAIIAGGVVTPEGVWISGRVEDFEELLGSVAAQANHEKSAKRRRLLDAVYDRIDQMVAEST